MQSYLGNQITCLYRYHENGKTRLQRNLFYPAQLTVSLEHDSITFAHPSLSLTVAANFKTLRKFLTYLLRVFLLKERKSNLSLTTTLPHRPAKIPKNLSKSTSKLSFLTFTSIIGDPNPFRNIEHRAWASTSRFLLTVHYSKTYYLT